MKIALFSEFHQARAEISFFTSNRTRLQLTGRQVRRLLDELCQTDGCDCFSALQAFIDEHPVAIVWIDRDAEDDRPGLELALPPAPPPGS